MDRLERAEDHLSILPINNFEFLFLCAYYFYKYVINGVCILVLLDQSVSQVVERMDYYASF